MQPNHTFQTQTFSAFFSEASHINGGPSWAYDAFDLIVGCTSKGFIVCMCSLFVYVLILEVQKQVMGGSEMREGMCDEGFPGHSQGRKPHWHTNRKQQCSGHNKNLDHPPQPHHHKHTLTLTHIHITGLYKTPCSKHFGTQSRMETHTVTFQQQTQSVICVASPH